MRATESDNHCAAGSFTEMGAFTQLGVRNRDECTEDAVSVRRGRGAFQADVNYGHWSGGVKGVLHHYSTRWAQSK
jgi:hypothetical protein